MVERYADPLDRASSVSQEFLEQNLARISDRNKPEQVRLPDGTWPHPDCIDCGEEIPQGRLELGKVRCIYCQEALERKL